MSEAQTEWPCDLCERVAIVTFTKDAPNEDFVGGLCEVHNTEVNQKVIIDRWQNQT